MSYTVPQVEVHQLFSEVPADLTQDLVAFVFGPNYNVHSYSNADEKDKLALLPDTGYTGSSAVVSYPNVLDASKIDSSFTKVTADNCAIKVVQLAASSGKSISAVFNSSDNNTAYGIFIPGTDYVSGTVKISAGSTVYIDHKSSHSKDILTVASVAYGSDFDTNGDGDTTDSFESFGGTAGTLIMFDQAISAVSPSTEILETWLCEVRSGVEIPSKNIGSGSGYYWRQVAATSSMDTSIFISFGITAKAEYDGAYHDIAYADLYVTYRELLTAYADDIHSVTYASDVSATLGTVSADNPLAQAVYNACLNSGGQVVRYMAVPTDDLSGYNSVLSRSTLTKNVYFLVPATRDPDVIEAVQANIDSMSSPTVKRWRCAFVSAKIPSEKALYAASTNSGVDFLSAGTSGDIVKFVTDANSTPDTDVNFRSNVKAGDILRYGFGTDSWGDETYSTAVIKSVTGSNRIKLESSVSIFSGSKVEIWHTYTSAQLAGVVKSISEAFSDRRMYNIYPDSYNNNGKAYTGEFAAAIVAGLVSSCLPQQPVTNLSVTGIDDIPVVYQKFSYDELNTMASGGTFIIMQDLPGDTVYIRHQLSTATADNNINTRELSITKNLDSISYFFDNLYSPYVGKYNITTEVIKQLETLGNGGIAKLGKSSYGLYGPQLISEGSEITNVEQDSILKDHANIEMTLQLPYPLNNIVLKLYA